VKAAEGACPRSAIAAGAIVVVYVAVFWFLLPAFLIATGLRLDALAPVAFGPRGAALALGWGALAGGIAVMVVAVGQLGFYGRGLPVSHLPPTDFVCRGLYGSFRHPVYLGYTLAFGGASVLIGSFWSLAFSTPLLVVGWLSYVRFYEEPVLVARFGAAYHEYQRAVPLIVPAALRRAASQSAEPLASAVGCALDAMARWTVLCRRGRAIFVTEGLFVAAGTAAFSQQLATLFIVQGMPRRRIVLVLAASVLAVFLLTRLSWWLGNWGRLRGEALHGLRRVGYVSWGVPVAFLSVSAAASAAWDYSFLMIMDVFVRGMFIQYALGRLGCLTYGCCWGSPCGHGGVEYRNPEAKVVRLTGTAGGRRYPTQVYSAVQGAALFVLLNAAASPALPAGLLTALAFMLYPLGRAWVQFHREHVRGNGGSFASNLAVCAVLFLGAWALLMGLDPRPGPASPMPWNLKAFVSGLALWPVILASTALAFFAAGFHWKRIGTW
jgi:protein-S-isoprenylcysteine O-methyltransferase Ste14/prolipoprotein diacylglyceryltransferase